MYRSMFAASTLWSSSFLVKPSGCAEVILSLDPSDNISLMSLLRKASAGALRNFKPKSGHSEDGFFARGAQEGKNGLIFGETPPPPGQKRKWESWEAPWYAMSRGKLHAVLACLRQCL